MVQTENENFPRNLKHTQLLTPSPPASKKNKYKNKIQTNGAVLKTRNRFEAS